MRSTRDFLTGILTGVAIGILTAPRSGKETRQLITDEAGKRSEDLKAQWEKGVAQAKDGFENVKSQVNQYVDQAKTQVNQYAQKAQTGSQNEGEQYKDQYNTKVDELAVDAHTGISHAKDSMKVS